MNKIIETERLLLNELAVENAPFIHRLVNTAEWKKYIGERNIVTLEDAEKYILKIKDFVWLVQLKTDITCIGVITFLKKDYLEHHDIGFAFLPEYTKKGYAYEAAKAVFDEKIDSGFYDIIQATTIPENVNSISLLKKLGFQFEKEIENEGEKLFVFSAAKK